MKTNRFFLMLILCIAMLSCSTIDKSSEFIEKLDYLLSKITEIDKFANEIITNPMEFDSISYDYKFDVSNFKTIRNHKKINKDSLLTILDIIFQNQNYKFFYKDLYSVNGKSTYCQLQYSTKDSSNYISFFFLANFDKMKWDLARIEITDFPRYFLITGRPNDKDTVMKRSHITIPNSIIIQPESEHYKVQLEIDFAKDFVDDIQNWKRIYNESRYYDPKYDESIEFRIEKKLTKEFYEKNFRDKKLKINKVKYSTIPLYNAPPSEDLSISFSDEQENIIIIFTFLKVEYRWVLVTVTLFDSKE